MADPTSRFAQVLDYLVNQVPEGGPAPGRDPTGVGYVNVGMGPRDYAKAIAETLISLTPSGGEESFASLPGGFARRRVGEAINPEAAWAGRIKNQLRKADSKYRGSDPEYIGTSLRWRYHPKESLPTRANTAESAKKQVSKVVENTENVTGLYAREAYNQPLAVNRRTNKIIPTAMEVNELNKIQAMLDILMQDSGKLQQTFRWQHRLPEGAPSWIADIPHDIRRIRSAPVPSKRGITPYRTPEDPRGFSRSR